MTDKRPSERSQSASFSITGVSMPDALEPHDSELRLEDQRYDRSVRIQHQPEMRCGATKMPPKGSARLLFPQARLAQALHMQLLHPLVAEGCLLENCK